MVIMTEAAWLFAEFKDIIFGLVKSQLKAFWCELDTVLDFVFCAACVHVTQRASESEGIIDPDPTLLNTHF